MDGRVKTLHPKIHGGLLGRRGIDDAVMAQHGIQPIDLLVVNLYPFAQTVARPELLATTRRSRTSTSADRRCCGPRRRITNRWPLRSTRLTTRRCSPSWQRTAAPRPPRRAPASRPRCLRIRRATTPWCAVYLARRQDPAAERFPGDAAAGIRQGAGSALRREPAPAGGALPGAAGARAERRDARGCCRARISRSTTSPMRTRRIECVRQFAEPACVIVKHANPCGAAEAGLGARGLRPCAPHRPDLGVRRHHRAQPGAGRRARRHHPGAAVRRGARGARRRAGGAEAAREQAQCPRARSWRARRRGHQ